MHLDQVYALGRDLMDANGLQGWSLGWDRAGVELDSVTTQTAVSLSHVT